MSWIQSSKCDSNHCLQTYWKKSSRSGSNNGACLEAAHRELVLVRDSKLLDRTTGKYYGDILGFPAKDWAEFINGPIVQG